MLVHEFLEESARRMPDKTALLFQDQRFSYKEIDAISNQLAHALIDAGIKRGDRVSILLDNSIESVISIYAVLKASAVFSTLSPTLKSKKLRYILNNSESSFFISNWQKINTVSEAVKDLSFLKLIIMCGKMSDESQCNDERFVGWGKFIDSWPISKPDVLCINIDLANIIYTSGSTGDPKGVMMTHQSMVSAATSIIQYLENTESDIILNVLPLSFDYGLYQVIMSFMFGGTIVLEKSFTFPYVVIEKIIKEKITVFPAVPTIFAILLQLKNLKSINFQHLRCFTNTGAALPVHFINTLKKVFPHVKIYSMYGLTECKRVSYLPPEEIDRIPTSVGKGMPNEEVYIVNENGERVAPGMIGELVVRGANVMKGYWKSPEDTNRVLKPGLYPDERVLYTGDLFKMDDDGFLYFISRKDDLIKTRGERVSPLEIENALYDMDGVGEVAVIALPDEVLGSAIKVFIMKVNDNDLTKKDVIKYCSTHLESFMVPKYVEFVDFFKKTSSGKIDKKVLE